MLINYLLNKVIPDQAGILLPCYIQSWKTKNFSVFAKDFLLLTTRQAVYIAGNNQPTAECIF